MVPQQMAQRWTEASFHHGAPFPCTNPICCVSQAQRKTGFILKYKNTCSSATIHHAPVQKTDTRVPRAYLEVLICTMHCQDLVPGRTWRCS